MKFNYLRLVGPGGINVPRPMLTTVVSGPLAETPLLMLVDSGADVTMLPGDIAQALGIQPTGEKERITGFGHEVVDADVGEAAFRFGPGGAFTLTSRVVMHEALSLPLFGHRDFFNRYRVAFDASSGIFHVNEPARRWQH